MAAKLDSAIKFKVTWKSRLESVEFFEFSEMGALPKLVELVFEMGGS